MFSLLVSDPDSTKPWVISKELTLTLRFSLVNISMVDHGGKFWKTNVAKAVWLKWLNDVLYFLISDLMGQQATPCGWNKPRLAKSRKWKLNIDVKGKPPYAVASRGIFPVRNQFFKLKVTWAGSVFLCSTVFFWTKCKVVSQNISTFNMLLWVSFLIHCEFHMEICCGCHGVFPDIISSIISSCHLRAKPTCAPRMLMDSWLKSDLKVLSMYWYIFLTYHIHT